MWKQDSLATDQDLRECECWLHVKEVKGLCADKRHMTIANLQICFKCHGAKKWPCFLSGQETCNWYVQHDSNWHSPFICS